MSDVDATACGSLEESAFNIDVSGELSLAAVVLFWICHPGIACELAPIFVQEHPEFCACPFGPGRIYAHHTVLR